MIRPQIIKQPHVRPQLLIATALAANPPAAVTVVFRKTLSRIGTKTGSRQVHNT